MQDEETIKTDPSAEPALSAVEGTDFAQDDKKDAGRGECAQCQEYLSGWKRAQADYANLKKEHERTRGDIASMANERVLYELLPAIDQFEIALGHLPDLSALPDDERKKIQNWLTGIMAVKQLWEQTFLQIGLQSVKTEGAFDANRHEAAGQERDETKADGEILRVIQRGWMLNGKVLRPAKVIVNSINE